MMVNYPFFSFPSFRRYSPYSYSNPYPPTLDRNDFSNCSTSSTRFNGSSNMTSSDFLNSSFKKNVSITKSRRENSLDKRNYFEWERRSKKSSYVNGKSQHNVDGCEKNTEKTEDEEILFHIFGLKLHSDDILLICLIFFLYQEGVKDQYLFMALILLLLS